MPADGKLSPYYVTFKQLPNVIGVSFSRVHIRDMVQAGTFPEPFEVTPKRIGWKHSDLIAWAEQRELRAKCVAERRARKMAARKEAARSFLRKSVTRVQIESDEPEQRL